MKSKEKGPKYILTYSIQLLLNEIQKREEERGGERERRSTHSDRDRPSKHFQKHAFPLLLLLHPNRITMTVYDPAH